MYSLQRGSGVCCLIAQLVGLALGVRSLMCAPDLIAQHAPANAQPGGQPATPAPPTAASPALATSDCEHADDESRGGDERSELPRPCPFSAPGSCSVTASLPAVATATLPLSVAHTVRPAAASNPLHDLAGDTPFHPPRT